MNKVIWLTGLSGSGKTTISNHLRYALYRKKKVYCIDGDTLRAEMNNVDYSKQGRFTNVEKAVQLCKENEDKLVIVALISPLREMRDYARQELGDRFFEVYVQCSLKECIQRDVKGLYAKAIAGEITNFTGIDQPYEESFNPELIISTEHLTIEGCMHHILRHI